MIGRLRAELFELGMAQADSARSLVNEAEKKRLLAAVPVVNDRG